MFLLGLWSLLLTRKPIAAATISANTIIRRNLSPSSAVASAAAAASASPTTRMCSLSSRPQPLPELVVFDLDACFWDQETFELDHIPNRTVLGDVNGRGRGVIGVMSGSDEMRLHAGSLLALQQHADGKLLGSGSSRDGGDDGDHRQVKVCFASSAVTPFAEQIARKALQMLQVLPNLTVWELVVERDWQGRHEVNQIGRQPPLLSSDKSATHFPRIRELTGIRYDRMLFFDGCNWGDNCGAVARHCRESDTNVGPAILRTPRGLGVKEWKLGLQTYAQQYASIIAKTNK